MVLNVVGVPRVHATVVGRRRLDQASTFATTAISPLRDSPMLKSLIPKSIAAPFSRYAHAVEASADTRLLFVSGQVGIKPDGTMCESEEEQHAQAWRNLLAVLDAAGMGPQDLIEVTVYITTRSGVPLFRAARDKALDGREVATTLLIVAGLAGIDWKVEISAIAGKSP